MGHVRINIEHKGVSHEVEFPIHEEVSMVGQWFTADWKAIMRNAVDAISASVESGDE